MNDSSVANLVLAVAVLGVGGFIVYELVRARSQDAGPMIAPGVVATPGAAPAGAFFGFAPGR